MSSTAALDTVGAVGIVVPVLGAVTSEGLDLSALVQGGSPLILLTGIVFLARYLTSVLKDQKTENSAIQERLLGVVEKVTAAQTQNTVVMNRMVDAMNDLADKVNNCPGRTCDRANAILHNNG